MLGRIREKVKDRVADEAAKKIVNSGKKKLETWRGKDVSEVKPVENTPNNESKETPSIQAAVTNAFQDTKEQVSGLMNQISEGTEQKKLIKEKIKQLYNAADIVRFAAFPFLILGTLSFFTNEVKIKDKLTLLGLGVCLFLLGQDGKTICDNILPIIDNPMRYKELPRGNWNIKKIGDQLKEDTLISSLVIDKIIIPYKFGE